jgi:hypothetical protein
MIYTTDRGYVVKVKYKDRFVCEVYIHEGVAARRRATYSYEDYDRNVKEACAKLDSLTSMNDCFHPIL